LLFSYVKKGHSEGNIGWRMYEIVMIINNKRDTMGFVQMVTGGKAIFD